MSDRLPPAAAASTAEAAVLSSGDSPITNQSWGPKVKYQPMSLQGHSKNPSGNDRDRFGTVLTEVLAGLGHGQTAGADEG